MPSRAAASLRSAETNPSDPRDLSAIFWTDEFPVHWANIRQPSYPVLCRFPLVWFRPLHPTAAGRFRAAQGVMLPKTKIQPQPSEPSDHRPRQVWPLERQPMGRKSRAISGGSGVMQGANFEAGCLSGHHPVPSSDSMSRAEKTKIQPQPSEPSDHRPRQVRPLERHLIASKSRAGRGGLVSNMRGGYEAPCYGGQYLIHRCGHISGGNKKKTL